jgi:hypothetical protein
MEFMAIFAIIVDVYPHHDYGTERSTDRDHDQGGMSRPQKFLRVAQFSNVLPSLCST